MTTSNTREQLLRQIQNLPDEIVQQIADFTLFIVARRKLGEHYDDWATDQWQDFALTQFFQNTEDDVEYLLDDAEEIFHSQRD